MNNFELPGDCPSGEECPVHFRLDREIKDDNQLLFQSVTYVGNFCVLTGDNPKYLDPMAILGIVLDGKMPRDAFQTALYRVGAEGTLYDLTTDNKPLVPEQTFFSGEVGQAEELHSLTVSLAATLS